MNRERRVLACILLLLALEAPLAGANHIGEGLSVEPGDPGGFGTGIPVADTLRDDVLARQAQATRQLNELLLAHGAPRETLLPEVPATVFMDHMHEGGRTGGLGPWRMTPDAPWRVQQGGLNGTYWTIADPATGKYRTTDALLVLPVIDLSAYPLQTGDLPFANAELPGGFNLREMLRGPCPRTIPATVITVEACDYALQLVPGDALISDQINLMIKHRYDLLYQKDGAQVLLFERDPLQPDVTGRLLRPQRSFYDSSISALDGGFGFTGRRDWVEESFDLTPWAGKKVWIAFRVATSPQASADPGYFSPANFRNPGPYGWEIDDVEIVSPAYPNNLKVESITGPSFRATPQGPRIMPPGQPVMVGAEVLNAAAVPRATRVTLQIDGTEQPIEATFHANLSPGEVWMPNLTIQAPPSGTVRVVAIAQNPGPENTTLVDPTLDDNDLNATFEVQAIPRLSATLRPTQAMVDDGEEVGARAVLVNSGNVPLDANVTLTESIGPLDNATYRVLAQQQVALAPGANATLEWPLVAAPRGEHRLLLNVSAPGLAESTTRAAYYVHAAPPPVFNATGWPPAEGWNASIAEFPIPPYDDWMWVASPSEFLDLKPFLRATATPEAVAAGGRFTDLRLSVRYMAARNPQDARIDIQTPGPIQAQLSAGGPTTVPSGSYSFWSTQLKTSPVAAPGALKNELGLSWRTVDIPVDPSPATGYPGVWTSTFPELKITAGIAGAQNQEQNFSVFYLDDLRLTGIPVGGVEADRLDIIRITGAEPYPSGTGVNARAADTNGGLVAPGQPSLCPWETNWAYDTGNCFRPVHKNDLLAKTFSNLHWTNATPANTSYVFPDGGEAVYAYFSQQGGQGGRRPERLVSPTFRFSEVIDPRLEMDTLYAFPGAPYDFNGQPKHQIFQVGLVELQYRKDNGEWSDFVRLLPDGEYHSVLEFTPPPLSIGREPLTEKHYTATDGLHHPSPCRGSNVGICDAGGYHLNLGADGLSHWMDYGPYKQERLHFRLGQIQGVNLSNREARLGFHATTVHFNPHCDIACDTTWLLRDIRVTPVSVFAVDGTVKSVNLTPAYDWREIGVGPGTTVPVNVTVRNSGLYPERFELNLSYGLLAGETLGWQVVDVGQLTPGEERSIIIPWDVPLGEDRRYVLNATLRPLGGGDEKTFDDRASLGLDGGLRAVTRADVGLTGAVHPAHGRETLARRVPISLYNRGNVPLDDLRVTLTIERQVVGGSAVAHQVTWTIKEPLPADPKGVPLQQLGADPEIRPDDLYYTPGLPGEYLATFLVARTIGEDDDVTDNYATMQFDAGEPIFAEDFEDPIRWDSNAKDIWGEGPGFRSARSLLATDRETGALPPRTDAWIVTPPVRLSNAMNAIVNAFVKYDLEAGYDGVRLEVSKDGQTWLPVNPTDERGLSGKYPMTLVPSNPLSSGPADAPGAYSGDSRASELQIEDGWAPVSFDLQDVPELREAVSFRDLRAPTLLPGERIDRVGDGVYAAPSMFLDPADPDARWEIRNHAEGFKAPTPTFWWSGYASTDPNAARSAWIQRDFNVSTAQTGDAVVLSWWDWRAGSTPEDWNGISGKYNVRLLQKEPSGLYADVTGPLEVGEPQDGWFPMRVVARADRLNVTYPFRVQFDLYSQGARANNLGWAVDEIRLATERIQDGAIVNPRVLTSAIEDEDAGEWFGGWSRVSTLPTVPYPWGIAVEEGADGTPHPVWRADIRNGTHSNSDSRLVSPAVDLSEVGGARVGLRVTHRYDLAHDEDPLGPDMSLGQMKAYRAGTVEIQIQNRTTGQWDPWRQLFAPGQAPSEGVAPRPDWRSPTEGAPYNATLVASGDTFRRYARTVDQTTRPNPTNPSFFYVREHKASVSYAFAGPQAVPLFDATGKPGFLESEFDLTPYAGQRVRFAFHAYAGAVDPGDGVRPQGYDRFWSIDNAQVVGYVLSSPDVQLRWRLGTDASIQPGAFAVDQLEVSGRQYERSIGIELDPVPAQVAPQANFVVSGHLVNYGPETRRLVAIGLREGRGGDFREVLPITARPASYPEAYAGVSGPFDLAPAGTPGSRVRFEFNVGVDVAPAYNLTLDVLEARVDGGGFSYRAPADDVPGRAHRAMDVRTADRTRATVTSLSFAPSALAAPGNVAVSGAGANVGTREVNVTLSAKWFDAADADKRVLAEANASVGKVQPGRAFTFAFPPVRLPAAGNYTVQVSGNDVPAFLAHYRVGRTDVNHSASFDGDYEGWRATTPLFSITGDDAAFGNASILFGLNNSRFIDEGERLMDAQGTLFSPALELLGTGAARNLTFWHKPLTTAGAGGGTINVSIESLNAGDPVAACSGQNALRLATFAGRADRWTLVTLPLNATWNGCSTATAPFRIRFDAFAVDGQGWRLDGVTVGSGALTLKQAADRYVITDSARKEYPVVVSNPGHVPKDVEVAIDPLLSRLSPAQLQWLDVTPRRLRIEPGASATVTLRVDTPAARGAFPQTLDAVLSATDLAAPYAPVGLRLNLDFRPLPRQDLSVAASVDGKPLGAGRADVEEAVPHEVSVVLTNQGAEESGPTDVRMDVIDDATGRVLWTQTRSLPPLGPYAETEESFIVSGAWKPAFGARGNHTLHVVVDPDRRLVDYDRSNDDVRIPLAVVRLIRPDLAVDARGFGVTTPGGVPVYEAVPGQLVRVAAAVTNDGYADAHDVTLRLLAGASVLKEEFVPILRPGQTHVIRANQFAPNASVTYRVLAFTPDLELLSENNERTVELPVFPAEVRIEAEALDAIDPGETRLLNVTLVDDGPYPLTLRLEAKGGPLARLDRSQVALAPGESTRVPLRVTAAPDERAGTHLLVLRAIDGDTVRAQRTIPIAVAERPAALLLPHLARGPPEALLVQLDAVNTGNVALDGSVVVTTSNGTEVARADLAGLAQGRRDLVSLRAALPPQTPPGRIAATLSVVRGDETLAATPIELDVLPYSDLDVRATPRGDGAYDVRVEHRGNARATRDVVLLDVPEGVDARPSQARLTLDPGATAEFTVQVQPQSAAPNGLFRLHVALIDPAPAVEAQPHLAPLTIDLRAPKLDVAEVRRDEATPREGGDVTFRALVRNDGAKDARGVPVELYVDGLLVDRKEVDALPPGESTTVELTWTAVAGAHGVVVAVDPHGPLGDETAAYTERVQVAASLVPGASFARELPVPWLALLVVALAAGALARRRTAP